MCGLVGVLTTSKRALNNNELKMFKMMLRFDVIRGDHSTGMIGVDREKGGATIYKHMGGPVTEKTFTSNGGKNPLFKDDGGLKTPLRALFGHNRFATMGKLDVDNAHPFIAGKLVGMHNGTVKPYILERIEKENPYGTDSEFIYNKIHENGLTPTIKELDGGAWCLTYYDFHKKTYNFLRNDERPLYIAWDKLGTMAWASEEWMIKIAANKCWWKYDEISMLKPNTHLEIDEEGNVEKTEVKAEERGFFHNRSQTYTQVYSRTNTTGFNVEEKNTENIRKMKDKVVELSPVRILSEHGQEYIECHLEGWSDPDDKAVVPWASVRIYLQKKDKDLRDWVNEPYMPTGDFL